MVSNSEFAQAVGCHFSHASRLRNGLRLPSAPVLLRIQRVYGLDLQELMDAYAAGADELGRYLRTNVFDVPTAA